MSLLGSRLVIGLRLRPALEEAEIDVPQSQPRRQNPAQHRRNDDLNREAPTPRAMYRRPASWAVVSSAAQRPRTRKARLPAGARSSGARVNRASEARRSGLPAPRNVCHRRTVHSTDQRCASALPATASPISCATCHFTTRSEGL